MVRVHIAIFTARHAEAGGVHSKQHAAMAVWASEGKWIGSVGLETG
jgi:hypothetical protein